MKILLVQPPQFGKPGFNKIAFVEPLGLEMVAGALLPSHEVRIQDMRVDDKLERAISDFRPDAVGISCSFTIDVYRTRRIAKTCRTSGVPFIFVGGLHASLNPPDFEDPAIDCIVVGEGESGGRELIAALEGGIDLHGVPGLVLNTEGGQVFTGQRERTKDLDELPFPARELVTGKGRGRYFFNFWKPLATLETARGCPHRCNFCSVWTFFHGRCTTKSPERVADELSNLREKYVLITDDNFLLSVKRASRIAEIIKERGIAKIYSFQARSDTIVKHPEIVSQWREIGLHHVFIGFESLNEEELKAVNKKNSVQTNEEALRIVHEHDISVTSAFIVNPDYGHKEFSRLREYIARHHISVPQFTVLTPLPGTNLFKEIENNILTKNCEMYDFLHSVLPTRLEPREFYKEFASLYGSAYINSGVLKRRAVPLMKGLATRRLSIGHLRRILHSAREFADGSNYLKPLRGKSAGHPGEAG
ncbi:MAG: B12-binding domain-containing radical SAM protein [Actinobacteria bacterium]|nr:B12-binding domain-containing radical SAM protein [Actinomycetota bacterium]